MVTDYEFRHFHCRCCCLWRFGCYVMIGDDVVGMEVLGSAAAAVLDGGYYLIKFVQNLVVVGYNTVDIVAVVVAVAVAVMEDNNMIVDEYSLTV